MQACDSISEQRFCPTDKIVGMCCRVSFLLVRRLLDLLGLGPTPDEKDVEIAVLRLCVPKTRSEGSNSQFVLMDQASKSVVSSKAARVNSAHWGRSCLPLR